MTTKRSKGEVVVVAAGASQVPVIRFVRSLGYRVCVVDRDRTASGADLADIHIVESTYDVEGVLAALEGELDGATLCGVINRSSGPPVVTAAAIANRYGCSGVTPRVAEISINKRRLAETCGQADVPLPQIFDISNLDVDVFRGKDLVLRPEVSVVGKGGVLRVGEGDDLQERMLEAKKFSLNGEVLAQEYVDGDDVSLISMCWRGKIEPLALLDEHNAVDARGRHHGRAFSMPSRYAGSHVEESIIASSQRLADHLSLETTPFLVSYRVEDDEPLLIELHLDLGGDGIIDKLIPAASGFDAIQWFVEGLLGNFATPDLTISPTAIFFHRRRDSGSRAMKIVSGPDMSKYFGCLEDG